MLVREHSTSAQSLTPWQMQFRVNVDYLAYAWRLEKNVAEALELSCYLQPFSKNKPLIVFCLKVLDLDVQKSSLYLVVCIVSMKFKTELPLFGSLYCKCEI